MDISWVSPNRQPSSLKNLETVQVNIIEEKEYGFGKFGFSYYFYWDPRKEWLLLFSDIKEYVGFEFPYQLSIHVWNQHMQGSVGDWFLNFLRKIKLMRQQMIFNPIKGAKHGP